MEVGLVLSSRAALPKYKCGCREYEKHTTQQSDRQRNFPFNHGQEGKTIKSEPREK